MMSIRRRLLLIGAIAALVSVHPVAVYAQADEFSCSNGPGPDGLIRVNEHHMLSAKATAIDPEGGLIEAATRPGGLRGLIRYARNDGANGAVSISVMNAGDVRATDWITLPAGRSFVTGIMVLTRAPYGALHVDAGSEMRWTLPASVRRADRIAVYVFDAWRRRSAGPFAPTKVTGREARLTFPAGTVPGCAAAIIVK